jgi:hypothetical protein
VVPTTIAASVSIDAPDVYVTQNVDIETATVEAFVIVDGVVVVTTVANPGYPVDGANVTVLPSGNDAVVDGSSGRTAASVENGAPNDALTTSGAARSSVDSSGSPNEAERRYTWQTSG